MIRTIVNAVSFQSNWFVVIFSAAAGRPWIGIATSLAFAGACIAVHRRVPGALRLIAACVAIGWVMDSALVLSGLLGFPEAARLGAPTTLWMLAMWAALACTLNGCMAWMQGRVILAAVFGFIGGATSYYAGMRLGAVEFPAGDLAGSLAAGVEWAIAMPLLAAIAPRLDPVRRGGSPSTPSGEAAS